MSSAWIPPRADNPSVVSNRVFTVRRLNKLESKRLGTKLSSLDAEVAHSRTQISQEQEALRKELLQIKEVKRNPKVGLERRKLIQANSSKETARGRLNTVNSQTTEHRYRSLSDSSKFSSVELPPLGVKSRSKSANNSTSPRGLHSTSFFQGNCHTNDIIKTCSPQENTKRRPKNYSTNTHPLLPEWGGKVSVIDLAESSEGQRECDAETRRHCWGDQIEHETHYLASLLPGRRQSRNGFATTVCQASQTPRRSDMGMGKVFDAKGPPVAGKQSRKQRSFSVSSAPVISEGRVVRVSQDHETTDGLHCTAANLATLHQSNHSRSVNSGEQLTVHDVDVKKAKHLEKRLLDTCTNVRRRRYSTNSQPVISEGKVVEIRRSDSISELEHNALFSSQADWGGYSEEQDTRSLSVNSDADARQETL